MILQKIKDLAKMFIPQSGVLQRFYLGIYYVGLWGMNYGRTADLKGSGELKALHSLKTHLGERPVIFDVGANVGDYTIALTNIFPKANIHTFEPVKKTFDALVERTQNHPNITPYHLALGDENKQSQIFFGSKSSHSSLVGNRSEQGDLEYTENIQIERLDDLLSKVSITNIDFLKIDVEGFEINVLKGAQELIKAKKIKCIQFEFGGTMIDARVFLRDFYVLLGENYELYRITKSGLFPIGDYKPHHEIFHYCNYMAILKD
ncbi:MAG: FkbM family methyltransferase [Marinoscillum sp.]|jgi:FkbM family methyltransferase